MSALKFLFTFLLAVTLFASNINAATIKELYEQAVEAYNQQQFDRSIELYQEIVKTSPRFAPAYVGIGLALKSKNADVNEVLYYYKMATDMDPTNAQTFEQLGRLYYSLNKFDKAEKNFLKTLSIDPGSLTAKLSLAWIYLLGKSRPKTAIRYFQEVLKHSPGPNTYFGLGMAYFASNDRIAALEMITQLHKMGEDDYAERLEKMVRENQKVAVQPSSDTPEDSRASAKPATPVTPAAPVGDIGVKVRLRGKLSEVD
jgi:tetratricopeptide (TPR) repeat protein